jgi:molecular chaperone DnaK (HSP70)
LTAELENQDRPSRYVVGIDLGTTNSAVAYVDAATVDTATLPAALRTFGIAQLVAPSVVEARETLPSFLYQPAQGEFPAGALRLPWSKEDPSLAVGIFAREHGAVVPGRLIASAKSWLCHSGVDRLAELLPWHGASDVPRLSPVDASAQYLAHIREAWNARFAGEPLESQEIVLTLPASFDEVARELTVRAAAKAGLPRIVLIEEPQAAFYAWLDKHAANWEQLVAPGQKILICDIGGGTSDFTLIQVSEDSGGKVRFHRVAVGEHLILGGDNLDLALAHFVEQRLLERGLIPQGKLEPRQWAVLIQSCRQVKESLLGENAPERLVVNLPGSGSRLIGGALQVEVACDEVRELLVEGFFPRVGLTEKPATRRSGFQEFGLPYAPDAAITRYLAAFLMAHRAEDQSARPDVVLLNGGVFASPVLRERLLDVVSGWFADSPGQQGWRPRLLENERLDLAVAQGAAYYGMVRRGVGVRISAALARSYFIGVDTGDESSGGQRAAVCLVPAGVEEGETIDLTQRRFKLLIREPVEFPLFVSSTQLTAERGELLPIDPEQMTALPPIRTVLQSGKKSAAGESVTVDLHARLTEIGTLDLWCGEVDGPRTWRLQFDVRAATQTDAVAHEGAAERQGIVEEPVVEACRQLILQTFSPAGASARERPEDLIKRLGEITEMSRQAWPPSLLRSFWETLVETDAGRKLSATHEARWLNLLGFALRPGYGFALDDWRVAQTWRMLLGKLAHGSAMVKAEWWILWRRICAGLPAGQQRALAGPIIAELRGMQRALAKGRGAEFKPGTHEAAEIWRLLGSLELLNIATKAELGNLLVDLAAREKTASVLNASLWALGRIGARVPMYGPLNTVLAADVVGPWVEAVMGLRRESQTAVFAVMQMTRKTGDRYRDIPPSVRTEALDWLRQHEAPAHFVELVEQGGELEQDEQGLVFGESLPQGLRIA